MQNEAEWDSKTDDELLRYATPQNWREAILLSRLQHAVERLEDAEHASGPTKQLLLDEVLEQVSAMETRPVQLALESNEQHSECVALKRTH